MSYTIKNNDFGEEFKKAEMSEGYFILLTRLNDGMLTHYWYRSAKFNKNDIPLSMNHHINTLKGEMPASTSDEPTLEQKEKILPPEYRNEN